MKKSVKTAAGIFSLALIFVLLVTSIDFHAFNKNYYREQYIKLNTADSLGMSDEDLFAATETLLDYLHDQLSRYPIAPFFEEVLGIHDVYARSKESLAQRFIAHSGIDPQGVVFAGDSVHDYEVASAAGCRCVLIANGHEHKDKLKQCGCPVVDDISAFASLF